jgi:acyl carrier protein phosphodiesterase
MNYLAHALLSGPDDELRLGNFLGDFVKGRVENYQAPGVTERIRAGIRLHRSIDSYTDHHPVVRRSKARLVPRYGLRAGIIIDVTYDHFLAKNWATYSQVPLSSFSAQFYRLLATNLWRLPTASHRVVEAMTHSDWLTHYADLTATERALAGLAHRARAAAGIQTAGDELRAFYQQFEGEFHVFFPEVRQFCQHHLNMV